jgi:hypothetical protein
MIPIVLRNALDQLQADVIAVPPLELKYLRRGHAVHFRCRHPEAPGLRVDVMSVMRGVDAFAALWRRRTIVGLPEGLQCDLLSVADLVQAKKTQRDRDWPMIRRLVEAHYFQHRHRPAMAHVTFWLRELRTPALLTEVARSHHARCRRLSKDRPLLAEAPSGNAAALEHMLHEEEVAERQRDRLYWLPLRRELERLRHVR